MFILLTTLWLIWEIKYVLFWLYLWQLKDYHVGRFIDHFRTHKGKNLIFNFAQILKIILFILLILSDRFFVYLFSILFVVYFFELLMFLLAIFKRAVRKPVITVKTLFLTAISFAAVALFVLLIFRYRDSNQPPLLLIFDILTPIIISVIVLLFQPIFVLLRNSTLDEAREKMKQIRSVSGVKVIAITGSYGKTSTKEFLYTILSKKFKVLKTKEHQNSEIGVANCILNDLKPSHQIFIAEVGAYDKGKVREVCSMLKPKIGIVTGVNEQHLALFGSLENLLSAEGGEELAEILPQDGLLVVNGDNKYCLNLYKRAPAKLKNKKIYTLSNKTIGADIWSDEISVDKDKVGFLAIDKTGEMMHFNAKVLGKQNVQNLLGAILVAKNLGMTFDEITEACNGIHQEQAGMTLKLDKRGINIIDSSYSANPDGVFADLDYFNIFQGKKVVVMPCLIELGEKSIEIHKKIGRKIGEVCDFAIITTKDKFKEIKSGAMEAGMAEKDILLCDKSIDIFHIITLLYKSGDAVLLEGRVPSELTKLLSA